MPYRPMSPRERADFDSFSETAALGFAVLLTLVLLVVWWPLGLAVGLVLFAGRRAHRLEQRRAAVALERASRPALGTILEDNAYGHAVRAMPPRWHGHAMPAHRPTPLDDEDF